MKQMALVLNMSFFLGLIPFAFCKSMKQREPDNVIKINYSKGIATPTKMLIFAEPADLVEVLGPELISGNSNPLTTGGRENYAYRWKSLKPGLVRVYVQEVDISSSQVDKELPDNYAPSFYFLISEDLTVKQLSGEAFEKYTEEQVLSTGAYPFSSFSFSRSSMNYSSTMHLDIRKKQNRYYMKVEGFDTYGILSRVLPVPDTLIAEISRLAAQHKVFRWHKFHKSDKQVRDGTQFNFYMDGPVGSISASGYMVFPDGYREFMKDFEPFFERLLHFCRQQPIADNWSGKLVHFQWAEDKRFFYEFAQNGTWSLLLKKTDQGLLKFEVDQTFFEELLQILKKFHVERWYDPAKLNTKKRDPVSISLSMVEIETEVSDLFYNDWNEAVSLSFSKEDIPDYPAFRAEVEALFQKTIEQSQP